MRKDQSSISLEGIPVNYHKHNKLFLPETAEKLVGRRTFDHAIDLVPGAIPSWRPIYPMSAHQLDLLDKYLKKMLQKGKISQSKSRVGAQILFFAKIKWIHETMCRLSTTKQAHHRKQIPTTINDRTKRSGCRSNDFHQVGPQGWIPFIMDHGRRLMENGFSYTLRALRVQSNAIRTGQ